MREEFSTLFLFCFVDVRVRFREVRLFLISFCFDLKCLSPNIFISYKGKSLKNNIFVYLFPFEYTTLLIIIHLFNLFPLKSMALLTTRMDAWTKFDFIPIFLANILSIACCHSMQQACTRYRIIAKQSSSGFKSQCQLDLPYMIKWSDL